MTQRPDLFWGLIASMWIGNLMLLVLNLPLIGLWVKLLTVPYRLLFPAIMVFMAIGVYSVNNNALDIHLALLFGVLGYVFIKLKCEPAPLILAVVLGPLMEENLRRALLISRGDASVLVTRPISAGFLIATLLLLAVMIVPAMMKEAGQERPKWRPTEPARARSRAAHERLMNPPASLEPGMSQYSIAVVVGSLRPDSFNRKLAAPLRSWRPRIPYSPR